VVELKLGKENFSTFSLVFYSGIVSLPSFWRKFGKLVGRSFSLSYIHLRLKFEMERWEVLSLA